jgi:hypothetical protein
MSRGIIKYAGVTIWDSTNSAKRGVSWLSTKTAAPRPARIESRAPIGVGYWLKPGGTDSAEHTVDLVWLCSTAANAQAVTATLHGLTGARFGTFEFPDGRNITNCAIDISNGSGPKYGTAGWFLSYTITVTEYP